MRDRNSGMMRWVVGNPIYVVSAAVMMYGVTVLLNHQPPRAGDVTHILGTYLTLQVYEVTLIALAAWILLKLFVRDDGATLLALECLVFGAAFITLDELLAANLATGMTVAAGGLVVGAIKLAFAHRPLGIRVSRTVRVSSWVILALPIAWVPMMKSVVEQAALADTCAYLAWWCLSGVIFVSTVGVWAVGAFGDANEACGRLRGIESIASAILVVACIGAAAGHLFSLHHSFLASVHLWYIAPVCVSVSMAIVWGIHLSRRANRAEFCIVATLPFAALFCFSADRMGLTLVGGESSPLALTRYAIAAVYVCLVVMTRRTLLIVHVLIAFLLAIEPQRQHAADQVATHVSAHEGWYLVALAFALFIPGLLLSYYKSGKRNSAFLGESTSGGEQAGDGV